MVWYADGTSRAEPNAHTAISSLRSRDTDIHFPPTVSGDAKWVREEPGRCVFLQVLVLRAYRHGLGVLRSLPTVHVPWELFYYAYVADFVQRG